MSEKKGRRRDSCRERNAEAVGVVTGEEERERGRRATNGEEDDQDAGPAADPASFSTGQPSRNAGGSSIREVQDEGFHRHGIRSIDLGLLWIFFFSHLKMELKR